MNTTNRIILRMEQWQHECAINSTLPTLLVSVAQDENQGKVSVKVPEGVSNEQAYKLLEGVLAAMKTGHIKVNQ